MDKKNIIVGAARVFLGPALEVPTTGVNAGNVDAAITAWKPTAAAGTSYAETVAGTTGWRGVGYTQDGFEVATDPSYGEVEVDQLLDSARIFKDGMTLSISTTFAEATLENLLVAWGQADSTLTSSGTDREITVESGGLGDAPLERGLIAVGNGPETGGNKYSERTYFAYRVLSVEGGGFTASRSDATTIPVTFRALPADNGRYGSIRDRVVA